MLEVRPEDAAKSNVQAPREAPNLQPLRRIFSFATILAIGFVLGRISGLLREMIVSAAFGLSAELDAYFLALVVPTIINNIVAGSAISVAAVPVFSRYLAHGDRAEFWRVASIITNFILLVTGGLTILGMVLAAPIIAILGMGLAPATQTLAASMLVIMMPILFLSAFLNMLLAILNALDRFWAPALVFLAVNVGIISAVFVLAPFIGVYAVAWGFLFGVTLQVAVQLIALRREQPQYHWQIDLRHPAVREVARAFVPITALSIIAQINLVVDKAMAATLSAGSVSALNYADIIVATFYMLGISLSVAVFPSLSRMIAINDHENTTRTVLASLRMLIFILAPLTFLLIPFAAPTIGLIFGRGKFDANDVTMTAQALAMYAIGLIATAAIYVLQRVFYALRDNLTPFVVGALTVAVHLVLNWILMRDLAHAGIALSTSLTTITSALVLTFLLARQVRGLELKTLMTFLIRCITMAAISTLPVAWIFSQMQLGNETLNARVIGVAFGTLGGVIYLAFAFATRTHEPHMLFDYARGLLQKFAIRNS